MSRTCPPDNVASGATAGPWAKRRDLDVGPPPEAEACGGSLHAGCRHHRGRSRVPRALRSLHPAWGWQKFHVHRTSAPVPATRPYVPVTESLRSHWPGPGGLCPHCPGHDGWIPPIKQPLLREPATGMRNVILRLHGTGWPASDGAGANAGTFVPSAPCKLRSSIQHLHRPSIRDNQGNLVVPEEQLIVDVSPIFQAS